MALTSAPAVLRLLHVTGCIEGHQGALVAAATNTFHGDSLANTIDSDRVPKPPKILQSEINHFDFDVDNGHSYCATRVSLRTITMRTLSADHSIVVIGESRSHDGF